MDVPYRAIAGLRQGMNACLLYGDQDEPIPALVPYLAAGLTAGERCVCVVGEHSPGDVLRALWESGVDVERERARGALVTLERWDAAFSGDEFDPKAMIDYVRRTIQEARAAGFTGLRILAEMTWALQVGVNVNRLIQYEALGCGLYPHEPLVAVCLYNRSRFPEAVCREVLRAHPLVIIGETVCENIFYELEEAAFDRAGAEARIDWMLGQLVRLAGLAELDRATPPAPDPPVAVELEQPRRDFLALTAHELRNPLTTIRGLAQLMRRRGVYQERVLDGIIEQTIQLERLVGDLLDASLLETGRLELRRQPADLVELARACVEQAQAQSETHTVQMLVSASPISGSWDPDRLRQVFANLLGNAIRYSPASSEILVAIEAADDRIVVSIRDRGPGIAPEALPKLFDRFYRAGATGHRDGLGLGLYISRGIVEAHGGEIGVESEPGQGSTFRFSLPLTQPSPS